MQFYLITGIIENEKWEEESDSRMERVRIRRQIYAKTEVFNRDLGEQAFVSLVDTENGFAQILAMLYGAAVADHRSGGCGSSAQ